MSRLSLHLMLKKIPAVVFASFCLIGIAYLALPNYKFPDPPPDAIVSQEPADLETPLRRGYFTNLSREETLNWYKKQFDQKQIFGINVKIPTLLFNYPPENSATLIREQTESTFLQEFVHPFRESVYVNGDKPTIYKDKPAFFVNGQAREQKIIIRTVDSSLWMREFFFIVSMIMTVVIYRGYRDLFKKDNE